MRIKHITTAALALALALSSGAAFAQWNTTTMPLSGGWSSTHGTGPNGQSFTATTMPLSGGWSSTQYQDSQGRSGTCTTMPMGGGTTSTQCQQAVTDDERQELKDRLLMAQIANVEADTAYKRGLLKYEPWKLTALAFGAGATVMGAIIGLLTLILRH